MFMIIVWLAKATLNSIALRFQLRRKFAFYTAINSVLWAICAFRGQGKAWTLLQQEKKK